MDQKRLAEIVSALADRVEGDWLLVGGAAAALWFAPRRTTQDLDIVAFDDAPSRRMALFDAMVELSLPIEAVNSAADFFVKRIEGWRDHVELLRAGARGNVYRPDATLFLLSKIGRLSQTDLADCLALLRLVRRDRLLLDVTRLIAAIERLTPPDAEGAPVVERRARLMRAIERLR